MEQKWISVSEKLPEVKKENDYWSDNVLAWCSGTLHIMSYGWVDEGDEGRGYVWANCYGLIDGDPEWDDNYTPTHWMPLPAEPTQIAQKEQSIIANVSKSVACPMCGSIVQPMTNADILKKLGKL